jgi:hypothetical protein
MKIELTKEEWVIIKIAFWDARLSDYAETQDEMQKLIDVKTSIMNKLGEEWKDEMV